MKKILALLLSVIMVLSFAACSGSDDNNTTTTPNGGSANTETPNGEATPVTLKVWTPTEDQLEGGWKCRRSLKLLTPSTR